MSVPLVSCPACGRQISSRATHCIHCGDPLSRATNSDQIDTGVDGWVGETIRRVAVTQLALAAVLLYVGWISWTDHLGSARGFGLYVVVLCGLAGAFFLGRWILRLLVSLVRPERYVGLTRLRHLAVPGALSVSLNTEIPFARTNLAGIRVSDSWILFPTWIRFRPVHALDAIWVYPKITKRYYWVIPMGSEHSVQLYDRFGRHFERSATKGEVQRIIAAIHQAAPWAFTGYSDELARKVVDTALRATMVADVDSNRETIFRHRAPSA